MQLETWELLSYVVTVFGLPLAVIVFIYEQRQERLNEEDEVYQLLSDNYQDFLRIVLENPDLHLFTSARSENLTDEQQERMLIIFSMLISLFERAYLLLYQPPLGRIQQRRWASWIACAVGPTNSSRESCSPFCRYSVSSTSTAS